MMAAAPEAVAPIVMNGDPELMPIQQLCEGLVQRRSEERRVG